MSSSKRARWASGGATAGRRPCLSAVAPPDAIWVGRRVPRAPACGWLSQPNPHPAEGR